MNHYQTVQQIKVLTMRESLDILFFHTLLLTLSYKSFFEIDECVDIAQKTLSYHIDEFQPLSTDIHNVLTGILNNISKGNEDDVLLNTISFVPRDYLSIIRRIGNRQKYTVEMDYYLDELEEQLVIRNTGLMDLKAMVVSHDVKDSVEEKYTLYKAMLNYGMIYGRHNSLVQKYTSKVKELLDERYK